MSESKSPVSGTAIYGVWSLLFSLTGAEIRVLTPDGFHLLNHVPDLPASISFAPVIPNRGLYGYLAYTEPPDACFRVSRPPTNASDWMAVISMSENCSFYSQVKNVEKAGYMAAIVHNNKSDTLIRMKDPGGRRVKICSTFIGLNSSRLLEQYDRRRNVDVHIWEHEEDDTSLLIILAAVAGLAAIIIVGIVIGIGVHSCIRNRAQLLSRWKLKRLPVHIFKKGDLYENCAICLEEYEEGEKLRILPCAHAFHSSCIDVWLTKNKKTCPLCNETVDPRWRIGSRRQGQSSDERRPLLQPSVDDEEEQTGASPSLLINQSNIEVHPEPMSRGMGRRNYGAAGQSLNPGLSLNDDVRDDDDSSLGSVDRNTFGHSPYCCLDDDPGCARFHPAPVNDTAPPQHGSSNQNGRKFDLGGTESDEVKPDVPQVVILGRSECGSDDAA